MKKSFRAHSHVSALSLISFAFSFPVFGQAQNVELDPVVVSAARMPQSLSEASVIVDVISRQEIEQSGASNITEFLDSVGGLSVNRLYGRAGVDVSVDIGYLGEAGSQNVLVLIDGQRINSIDSASTQFSQLPLSAIQQIEIRKANGGVLFGDRAQGGVINIITRTDALKLVEISYGSFGYQKQDAYLGFAAKSLRGSVSLMNSESGGYRAHSKSDQQSVQLRLNADFPSGFASFFIRGHEENAKLPSFLTKSQYDINPRLIGAFPSSSERNGMSAGLKYEHSLSGDNTMSIDAAHQESKAKGYYSIKNVRSSISPEFRTTIFGSQAILGAEFYNAEANTKQGKQVGQKSQAIFTQLIYPWSDFLDVDVGLRSQKIESDFQTGVGETQTTSTIGKVGKSFGINSKLTQNSALRVGFLTGFRFPNADELYLFNRNNFSMLEINPSVKPMATREHFFQYGIRAGDINFSAHYRRIDSKDEIAFLSNCGSVGGVPASCNANLYDTNRSIFSLSAGWKVNRMALLKGSVDFVDASIASGANKENRIPMTPKQVIRLSYEHKVKDFTYNASINYRSSMIQAGDQASVNALIPSRTVVDLGVKTQFSPDVTGSIWIRNAFDKAYYDYATRNGIYPADGRGVFVSLKVRF